MPTPSKSFVSLSKPSPELSRHSIPRGHLKFYQRWENWRLCCGFLIATIPFFGPPFVTSLGLYFASANSGDHYSTGMLLVAFLVAIDIVVPILTGFKIHSKTPRFTINPKSALPSFTILYIAYGITTGLSWAWLGWAFFCSGNRYRQSQDNKIVGGAVIAGIEESREEEEIGLNILTFDGSRSTSDVDPVKPEGVLFFDEQEITGQASEGAGTLEKS